MKRTSYIILLVIFVILESISCSQDALDDVDSTPNSPTDVPINLLLPEVEGSMMRNIFSGGAAQAITTYVEHTTNIRLNPYLPRNESSGLWNSSYGTLKDLDIIIEKGSKSEKWVDVGIAKVITAFVLGNLTDYFGSAPYSEALGGAKNRNPHFDSQENIYNDIFDILDNAIADFHKNEKTNPGNSDLFFQGNKDRWEKVAWGLKARYTNRLSNKNPNGSAENALKYIQNSFKNSSESFVFSDYKSGTTNSNTFYVHDRSGSYAVSATILDVLNSFNEQGYTDPRAERWFNKIDGEVVGAQNGKNDPDRDHTKYSGISEYVLYGQAPQPLLTYNELKFIESEAYFRLGNKTKANAAYKEAVKLACSNAGLNQKEIDSYTNQDNVFVDDNSLTLNMIIKQKYLSFFMMQPIEAFNDYRRTGIPTLNNPNGIIKRLPYPEKELSTNPNSPTDINNQTIYTEKVWWAK